MSRSTWDRILALGWVLYGTIELSQALYYFIHIRVVARSSDLRDFIGAAPFWILPALLIAGGVGMVLGRRWAWITTLVLSLLYSAFSAFSVRAFIDIWTHFHLPIGEAARGVLPIIAFWALTVWTAVRFFRRPWKMRTVQVGEGR